MNKSQTSDRTLLFRGGGSLPIVLLVAAVWVSMLVGDWYMRFHWFRWQDTSWFYQKPQSDTERMRPPAAVTNAPDRGGDITRLVGLRAAASQFEEPRPETVIWTDEFGYRNVPPVVGKEYPIVVAGDSYMQYGRTMEESFPALLQEVSGVPVYSHSTAGFGSFLSVVRFLQSERFKARPPKVLVWDVVEREVGGEAFEGLVYQLFCMEHPVDQPVGLVRRFFIPFFPQNLRSSLPRTSMFTHFSRKIWNRTRFYAFGRLDPMVIPVDEPIGDRRVLFYYPSVDAMRWNEDRRDVKRVANAIQYLDDFCRPRGIRLVVALIPDKEQVYVEHVPRRFNTPERPIQPSCLMPLEEQLKSKGIPAVNLLPDFRQAAAEGRLLYWADDSHWNTDGIRIAVQKTWERVREYLREEP